MMFDKFPFRGQTPLKESYPRIPEEYGKNLFYYHQVDLLHELSAGKTWSWCEVRPDIIVCFQPEVIRFSSCRRTTCLGCILISVCFSRLVLHPLEMPTASHKPLESSLDFTELSKDPGLASHSLVRKLAGSFCRRIRTKTLLRSSASMPLCSLGGRFTPRLSILGMTQPRCPGRSAGRFLPRTSDLRVLGLVRTVSRGQSTSSAIRRSSGLFARSVASGKTSYILASEIVDQGGV